MQDLPLMYIMQPQNNLPKNMFSQRFLKFPSLPHISEQVSPSTYFHNINPMTLSLKPFIQPNNILMPSSLQNLKLLLNLPQTNLISHKLFSNRFQSHKLASKPINRQIDLPKSPLANNLSNLITIDSRREILASPDPGDQSLSSRREFDFLDMLRDDYLVLSHRGF